MQDDTIPEHYLKETTVEGHIQTQLSQAQRLHKEFAPPLQVVLLATTPLPTQAQAHGILFSRDLDVASAPRVDSDG